MASTPELSVLGAFALRSAGTACALPTNAQRVLGYLALNGTALPREVLAGRLWTSASQTRAQANLRTAVWRVRQAHPGVVDCGREVVGLGRGVTVDFQRMVTTARQLLTRELPVRELRSVPLSLLAADLLPGWDDDWLLIDRERHRQLRMHSLEELSRQLTEAGEYGLAVESAYAALAIEPLCESANSVLIRAHLSEGNRTEAVRQFYRFRRLLSEEAGLRPSPQLEELVDSLIPAGRS